MDFVTKQVLLGGVLPGSVMLGVLLWLAGDIPDRWSRTSRATDALVLPPLRTLRGALIVLLAAALCALAFLLIYRGTPLRPVSANHFVPWLLVPALLAGVVVSLRAVPLWARSTGVLIALLGAAGLANKGQFAGRGPREGDLLLRPAEWTLLACVVLGAIFVLGLVTLARRREAWSAVTAALVAVLASGLFMLDFASATSGQLVGSVGAVLSACAVAAWWKRGAGYTTGIAAFAGVALAGCLTLASLWGDAASNRDAIIYAMAVVAAPWCALALDDSMHKQASVRGTTNATPLRHALACVAAAGLPLVAALCLSASYFF